MSEKKSVKLKVRGFQPGDLEEVIRIANRAFREIRAASRAALGDRISDLLRPAGDAVSKGLEVKASLERNPENCVVCEAEGRIVGFATFVLGANKIGVICNNGADLDAHIHGIGQAMYREILRIFREKGMLAARVETGLTDVFAPARHAYERSGFDRCLPSVTYYMEL